MLTFTKFLLAFIFVVSGAAKLAGLEFEIQAFERWGYPLWFMYLTGVAEVVAGLALLKPQFSRYAAPFLSAIMLGAIATHIIHNEIPMLVIALAIFLGTIYVTFNQFKLHKKAAV